MTRLAPTPRDHLETIADATHGIGRDFEASCRNAGIIRARAGLVADQIVRLVRQVIEHRDPQAARDLTGDVWTRLQTRCMGCRRLIDQRLVRMQRPDAPLFDRTDGCCDECRHLDPDEIVARRQEVEPGWKPSVQRVAS